MNLRPMHAIDWAYHAVSHLLHLAESFADHPLRESPVRRNPDPEAERGTRLFSFLVDLPVVGELEVLVVGSAERELAWVAGKAYPFSQAAYELGTRPALASAAEKERQEAA